MLDMPCDFPKCTECAICIPPRKEPDGVRRVSVPLCLLVNLCILGHCKCKRGHNNRQKTFSNFHLSVIE